jgi:hypothetical protein
VTALEIHSGGRSPTLDLIDTLAERLTEEPLTVLGSQGQPVVNPLIPELRLRRATLAQLLRQLALSDAEAPAGGEGPVDCGEAGGRCEMEENVAVVQASVRRLNGTA